MNSSIDSSAIFHKYANVYQSEFLHFPMVFLRFSHFIFPYVFSYGFCSRWPYPVCGLEHFLMFPIYWEWSSQLITVIFFRGVETTNQHMSGGEKSEYMMSNYHFHRWNRNVWWSNHYCLLVIHSAFWVVQSPSYSRILIVQVKSVKMLLVVKQ